jgi:hypothetical protein
LLLERKEKNNYRSIITKRNMGSKEKKRKDKGDDERSVTSNTSIINELSHHMEPPFFVEARPKPPPIPYTPLEPIQEADPYRRREMKRHRAVACIVLEKCLSNLGVLAELQVGDKLDFTSTGDFVIQRPTWFNTFTRTIKGVDRWKTHEHIANLFGTAEAIVDEGNINDPRVRTALVNSVHGLRNLQFTYDEDPTFRNRLRVLLQRVEMRYDVDQLLIP